MSNSILPEGLLKFIDNYDEKHPNECSARYRNMYELKTVDMDGNVVDTQYALNLMTDYGFQGAYKYHEQDRWTESTARRIWIGDSTEYPKYDNKSLYSPITNSEPQGVTSNYNLDHCEGMRYNKTDKICSMTRKGSNCYYDYNILDTTGNTITEDKYIREIGVGQDKNSLVMHAKVYNEAGEASAIIKRPNQRLYITSYYTTTMDPKIIQDNYDNGIYTVIDMCLVTKQTAAEGYYINPYIGYTSNHTGVKLTSPILDSIFYGRYGSSSGEQNHYDETNHTIEWSHTNKGGGLIEGQYQYVSEAICSASDEYHWNANESYICQNHALSYYFINNEGPETIETTLFTNQRTNGLLSDNFGRWYTGQSVYGRIPTLDYDMQSSYMYNHETKKWDIQDQIVNNSEPHLYDYWIGRHIVVKMYITFMDRHQNVYVFVNPFTNRPITSFDNSGFTLYATDTYWDSDSWQIISNLGNIPEELGTKRYYISLTNPSSWPEKDRDANGFYYYNNGRGLFPKRAGDIKHEVIPAGSSYKNYYLPYINKHSNSGKTASSNKYGYVAYTGCIFYPDDINEETGIPYAYPLYGNANTPMFETWLFNFEKEDKILTLGEATGVDWTSGNYMPKDGGGWGYGFRVYDVSNTDHTVAPTYTDYEFEIKINMTDRWGSMPYYKPYASKSENGFVVLTGPRMPYNENSRYPYSTVINLYGGDDKNTVESYTIDNSEWAMAVDRSDYVCVLTKDAIPTMKIFDVTSKEFVKQFTFEEGHVINGFCGWKNYVYILTTKNSTRFSWVYHIEEGILEYLPTENFIVLRLLSAYGDNRLVYSLSFTSTDDCFVIAACEGDGDNNSDPPYYYEFASSYFTADNPTHQEFVLKNYKGIRNANGAGYVYRGSLQLKYINDEKRQLIYTHGGYQRFIVQDLGLRIDDPSDIEVSYFPYWNFPLYDRDRGPAVAIYKDRIFRINCKETDTQALIQDQPVEYCVPHKVTGTTRTVTSFNNPVRVSPIKKASITMTNRVDSNGIPVSVTDEPASGA